MKFYDFSGGMESAAMLVLERERIADKKAVVRWANTGKQFPEMEVSIQQIEAALGLNIVRIKPYITFDQFLFERGGMVKKGTTDCSRRMKRANLMRHLKTFKPPYEVNLGFNAHEHQRAADFVKRNERPWCHWRFPLLEAGIERAETVDICKNAGFSILVDMYKKMGRFDCFWCGNQTPKQALRVVDHYPELAKEWIAAEDRKGHGFMRIPLKTLIADNSIEKVMPLFACSCFGPDENVWEED